MGKDDLLAEQWLIEYNNSVSLIEPEIISKSRLNSSQKKWNLASTPLPFPHLET